MLNVIFDSFFYVITGFRINILNWNAELRAIGIYIFSYLIINHGVAILQYSVFMCQSRAKKPPAFQRKTIDNKNVIRCMKMQKFTAKGYLIFIINFAGGKRYTILIDFFLAFTNLQRTSSTASVYLPWAMSEFFSSIRLFIMWWYSKSDR